MCYCSLVGMEIPAFEDLNETCQNRIAVAVVLVKIDDFAMVPEEEQENRHPHIVTDEQMQSVIFSVLVVGPSWVVVM